MPKYIVTFTTPMTGCCYVDAKDYTEAYKLVNNKTYGQLKEKGFKPWIENTTPDNTDQVDVLEIEIDDSVLPPKEG